MKWRILLNLFFNLHKLIIIFFIFFHFIIKQKLNIIFLSYYQTETEYHIGAQRFCNIKISSQLSINFELYIPTLIIVLNY